MDVNEFKKLCDEVISSGSGGERSTSDAYPLIGKCCGGYSDFVRRKSRALIKQVIFDGEVNNSSVKPYLDILEMINEAARRHSDIDENGNKTDNTQFNEWPKLIEIALSTKKVSGFVMSEEEYPSAYNKEIEFSKACGRLNKQGISFEFKKDNVYISQDSYELVQKIIDNFIETIGGLQILKYTFIMLDPLYEPGQERFLIYRKTTQGVDYIKPEIPWGYLIALGEKGLDLQPKVTGERSVESYKAFLQFITDVVATFEIQPYVVWESIYVDNLKTVEFLQENVLYDNLISFFQLKSNYAIKLIAAVESHWGKTGVESYGFNLSDIIKVGLAIIESSSSKYITHITKSKVSKKCSLGIKFTEQIINIFYANKNNSNLAFPPLSEAIDHIASPLSASGGMYLALPKPITSLAVLNTILNQISKPDGIFDNAKDSSVGKFIEDFVYSRVSQSGVKCYRGDYQSVDKKIKGDCDLLIKTDGCIFIFEMKKKALTRKAMSGTDYQIIKDLADSVMRSQSQCAKIEYVLLSDKQLTLSDNGQVVIIPFNGERIVKVSLSLHDFGALQDKIILSTILKLSSQVNFSADESEANKRLLSWKQYVDIFHDYTMKSRELQEFKDEYYFNNMFMSIPQLLTILDDVNNENDFRDLSISSQHVTYSTRCFYKEYSLQKKMRTIK